MIKKTLKQASKDLQGLLDEVGTEQFPVTKALYMKDVDIVDADGRPLSEEDLDIKITMANGEEDEEMEAKNEEEELEDKAEEEEDEESKASYEEEEEKAEEDEEEEDKPNGMKSLSSSAINKMVLKALKTNVNPVRSKGLKSMRIDNDREGMKRWGSLKHINRIKTASGDPELEAYKFGRWAAACMNHKKSVDWCSNRGINVKAHTEGINSAGGFLVPDEFSDTLISLREEYGVARRNCKIEPMISDTKRIPKRSATLSASFVGEATTGTESTMNFQQVNLVAKKLMVLTSISSELSEDSLINLGDSVAGEIAYAFALKEDECVFLGDGTSTYGGIQGIIDALFVNGGASVYTAENDDSDVNTLLLSDINSTMAPLPQYADTPNCKWYMHKSVYSAYVERLMIAAGGNTNRDIYDGTARSMLMGYPVEFTQVMPNQTTLDGDASGANNVLRCAALFGDLSLATAFGDRRSNTISFSDSALNAFEQDEIVVRGTERFDFICHGVGTAAEAGPIVALKAN